MHDSEIPAYLEACVRLVNEGYAALYEPCPVCSSDCGFFSSGPKRTASGGCTTCDKWKTEKQGEAEGS